MATYNLPPNQFTPFLNYEDYDADLKNRRKKKEEEDFDAIWNRLESDDGYSQLIGEYTDNAMSRSDDTLASVGGSMNVALEGLGIDSDPEMFTLPSVGAAPTFYKGLTQAQELGAAIFGDDEDKIAARDRRRDAELLYKQDITDVLKDEVQGGEVSTLAYEATEALTQELPFLMATGGVGSLAKAGATQALKKGVAKKLAATTAAKEAGDLGAGLVERQVIDQFNDSVQSIGRKVTMSGLVGIHGTRSAGNTFSEAAEMLTADNYKKILAVDPTINKEEAEDQAYLQAQYGALKPAIASGAITGSLVGLFGATGIERVFANPRKGREVIKDFYKIFTRTGLESAKQFRYEAIEEGLDGTLQGFLAQKTFDPKRTNEEIFASGLHEGFLGGLAGAKIGGTTAFAQNFENWVDAKVGNRGITERDTIDFKDGIEGFIRKHQEELEIAEEDIPEAVETIAKSLVSTYEKHSAESEGLSEDEAEAATEPEIIDADEAPATDEELDVEAVTNQLFAEGKADGESGFTNSSITKYQRLKKQYGSEVAASYIEGFNSVDQTQLEKKLEEDTAPIGEPATLRQEVVDEATPVDSTGFRNLQDQKAKKDRAAGTLDQAEESAATNVIPADGGQPRSAMEGVNPSDRFGFDRELREDEEEELEPGLQVVKDSIESGYRELGESKEENLTNYAKRAKGMLKRIKGFIDRKSSKPKPKKGKAIPVPESVFKDLNKTQRFLEIQDAPVDTQAEEVVPAKTKSKRKAKGPAAKLPETTEEKKLPTKPKAKAKSKAKAKGKTVEQKNLEQEVKEERATYTEPDSETIVLANQRGSGSKRYYPEAIQGKKAAEEYDTGHELGRNKHPLTLKINRTTGKIDVGFIRDEKRVWAYRLTEEGQKLATIDTRKNTRDKDVINGAILPASLLTKNALNGLDEEGKVLDKPLWEFNEGNKKIPRGLSEAKEGFKRKGSDKTRAEEIVGAVKDEQLRDQLALLVDSGLLSEEGINSIILATNRYRNDKAIYPRANFKPEYLGQILENSFELLAMGSRYNEVMGKGGSNYEATDIDNLQQDSLKKLSGGVTVVEKKDGNGIIKLNVSGRTMYLRQYKEGFAYGYDKRSIKDEGAAFSNVSEESKLDSRTQAAAKKELAKIVQEDFDGMNLVALSNIVDKARQHKGIEETQAIRLDEAKDTSRSDDGGQTGDKLAAVPSSDVESLATPTTNEAAVQLAAFDGKIAELFKKYVDVISNDRVLAGRLEALMEEGHMDEDGYFQNDDPNKQGEPNETVLAWGNSVDPNAGAAIADFAYQFFKRIHGSPAAYKLKAKKKGQQNTTGIASDIPVAQGKQQLEDLLSRDDTGLSQEQRTIGLKLLQAIHPDLLSSLKLQATPKIDSKGNTNVTYEGSFNSIMNLARVATSGNTSADVVAEEIAHFTAKLLPQNLRREAKTLRNRELKKKIDRLSNSTDERSIRSLEVLKKIKANGEVTSQEYAALLPKLGEAALNEIIEDTYFLSNTDEYYANGLVNRNNQSVFKKGVEYVRSLIDSLLSGIGNVGAADRQRHRKFYEEVFAVFNVPKKSSITNAALPGGLLFRENVEAASVSSVTSPDRLEAGVRLRVEQGKADKAVNLIRQSAAATGKLDSLVRKHIAADANNAVRKMLNLTKGDRINALSSQLEEKVDFDAVIEKFRADGHPELAKATALYAHEFIKIIEQRADKMRLRIAMLEKELQTPKFLALMRKATILKTKADLFKDAESDASKALANAIKIISTGEISGDQGRRSAIVQAVSDLAVLEQMQRNTPDLNNKVKEVVDLLYKSVTGQEILLRDPSTIPNTAEFGNEIFNWLANIKKGLGEKITKDERDMYRVAATLVASNANIKKNMLAVAVSEDPDIDLLEVEGDAKKLLASFKDPSRRTKAIKEAMRDVRDLTTKKARSQLLMQQSIGPVRAKLRLITNLKDAVDTLERVYTDPELVEYRRVTGLMAGQSEDRPAGLPGNLTEEYADGYISIPVPPSEIDLENPSGNVVRLQLLSGGKDSDQNLADLKQAALAIQEWLGKPENANSPYYDFYYNTLERLSKIQLSELVFDHPTTQRATPRVGQAMFLGIMDAMLDDLPTKSAAIARKYVEAHNLYYSWFSSWQERNIKKWRNLVYDAASSHGYEKEWLGNRTTALEAIKQWNEDVGRELRASWQEDGNEYKVGEQLSNGYIVTKEDMALLEYEDAITSEAFDFNREVTEYDESVQPQKISGILGTKRLPVQRGKMMLPRHFSGTGMELIKEFAKNKDRLEGPRLFDNLFGETEEAENALIAFISDRNPQWVKKTSDGVTEGVYNLVAEELRQGIIADKLGDGEVLADAIAQRIADLASLESVDQAKAMFMEEVTPTLEALERVTNSEIKDRTGDSAVTKHSYRVASPFQQQRKDVLAPYFFYDYGFNNDYEFGAFGFKGATGPAANVVTALKSALAELNSFTEGNQIKVLEKEFARKLGKGIKSKEVQTAVAAKLGLKGKAGGAYLNVRSLINTKQNALIRYTEDFEKAFLKEDNKERVADLAPGVGERLYGVTIGGVLMSVLTLSRNIAEAPIHGGIVHSMLLGNGAMSTAKGFGIGMLYTLWQGAKLSGRLVQHGGKAVTWGLIAKSIPSAIKSGKQFKGRPDAMLRGFLAPMVEEIANVIPKRNAEYEELKKFGLEMPIDPSETAGNFDRLIETGGRIVEGPENIPTKILSSMLGQYESGITMIGRTIFPRLGDMFGNNILAKMGYNVAHELEKRARLAYGHRAKDGTSLNTLDEPLTPEELMGGQLNIWKGNKASWDEMRKFLGKAGITNLNATIQDYWDRLAANERAGKSNRHENLFKAPERDRIASLMVTAINMATPSNRPLLFRNSTLARMLFSLMGWPSNAATLWSKAALSRSGDSASNKLMRLKEAMNSFIWIAMAMGAAIPENYLFEMLMREIELVLFGRHRITKLPHEASTAEQQAFSVLGLATTPVPFVGGALNDMFTGLPGRAVSTPGNLIMGKIRDVTSFAMDTYATGLSSKESWIIHGTRFLNSALPITRAVTRVVPYVEGMNKNLNTVRLIRKLSADQSQIKSPVGYERGLFSPSKANALTAVKKIWAGHVGNGNFKEAKLTYNMMVDIAVEKKLYKNKAEAKRNINAALRGITPIRGAYLTSPTKRTFYDNLSKSDFNKKKVAEVKANLDNWEKAFRQSGVGDLFRTNKAPSVSRSGRASGRGGSSRGRVRGGR